jgi:transposase
LSNNFTRLAQLSVGLQAGCEALQLALRLHLETWQVLQQQLITLETTLTETFLALPEAPYRRSIPTMSLITVATILSEIGDPSYYRNGRQLIKLAGIQPVPNT